MPASAHISDGRGIAEVIVQRSVEVVFDYVSDLRHMPTWWPSHRTYWRLLGNGGAGTLYGWTMPHGPLWPELPFAGLTAVTTFERPTRFTYRIFSPGLFTQMRYLFVAAAGGTRISLTASSAGPGFSEHVAAVFDALAANLGVATNERRA